MTLRDQVADILLKGLNRSHRLVLRATGGRVLGSALGMKSVDLVTIGRRSGLPRATMLTAPIFEPGRVVLVASKGGDDRHPDWYRNLVAHPEVTLRFDGAESTWTARVASATEKADLWPHIVAAYRWYDSYQRRTERDIPVVICEPR